MFTIRLASEVDAVAVASIIRESFLKQAQLLDLSSSDCPTYVAFETQSGVQRRMASGCQVALGYVAEQVAGTVSWRFRASGAPGEITRLAVLPSHRGSEYGRVLMRHAEEHLISAGVESAEISIVARFSKLRAYYEGLGYLPTVRKLVPSLPFELLFMEKALVGVKRSHAV